MVASGRQSARDFALLTHSRTVTRSHSRALVCCVLLRLSGDEQEEKKKKKKKKQEKAEKKRKRRADNNLVRERSKGDPSLFHQKKPYAPGHPRHGKERS